MTSVRYYDENAEHFFRDTVDADMTDLHGRFVKHVQPGGAILDAGCGSGRDALAFRQAGFEVSAFDASSEMVRLASAYSGLPVIQMTFDDVTWIDTFDGIWASASLLHLRQCDLPSAIGRLASALRVGGVLFMSFKRGDGERLHRGRHFTDLSAEALKDLAAGAGLNILEQWTSSDVRRERSEEFWVSVIAKRPAD